MKMIRWSSGMLAAVFLLATVGGALAQVRTEIDPAAATQPADRVMDRATMISEIVEGWRGQLRPTDLSANVADDAMLRAALQRASAEKLLAASEAQTYEELLAIIDGGWQGPSVIPLEPGAIPNTLGDANADLVYTPVSPCRIIDTRVATNNTRIGPNTGRQFDVNLSDYSSQGGFAGSCGIPIDPAAVAINVTSTSQTGNGNLRVVETGGGVPTVSLVNYVPGTNIANAGVSRSLIGGSDDIYIYSGNSASHVIVDIMGYYAAPEATALQCVTVTGTGAVIAAGSFGPATVSACTAGYTQVSLNCDTSNYLMTLAGQRATSRICYFRNDDVSPHTGTAQVNCCRVPGR